jgi:hypothetical protein
VEAKPTIVDWTNIEALVDSLVLMANSDALLNRLKIIDLESVLNALNLPTFGLDTMKGRLMAL